MSSSFGKKLGDYKNVKTGGQFVSLTKKKLLKKLNFFFFFFFLNSLIFGIAEASVQTSANIDCAWFMGSEAD